MALLALEGLTGVVVSHDLRVLGGRAGVQGVGTCVDVSFHGPLSGFAGVHQLCDAGEDAPGAGVRHVVAPGVLEQ